MADTSDFRNGFTMEWNNGIWTIIDFQHVKPGKGGAFVRTKLKNVSNGKTVDNTFRAGEKVEQVRVERGIGALATKDLNAETALAAQKVSAVGTALNQLPKEFPAQPEKPAFEPYPDEFGMGPDMDDAAKKLITNAAKKAATDETGKKPLVLGFL